MELKKYLEEDILFDRDQLRQFEIMYHRNVFNPMAESFSIMINDVKAHLKRLEEEYGQYGNPKDVK